MRQVTAKICIHSSTWENCAVDESESDSASPLSPDGFAEACRLLLAVMVAISQIVHLWILLSLGVTFRESESFSRTDQLQSGFHCIVVQRQDRWSCSSLRCTHNVRSFTYFYVTCRRVKCLDFSTTVQE